MTSEATKKQYEPEDIVTINGVRDQWFLCRKGRIIAESFDRESLGATKGRIVSIFDMIRGPTFVGGKDEYPMHRVMYWATIAHRNNEDISEKHIDVDDVRRAINKSRKRWPGYCALCRSKEIDLYGRVLGTAGDRHIRACEEAGCQHPPFYCWRI
jgi:hypothetical protein